MTSIIQRIPETEARQFGEWLLAQCTKLPGMTQTTRSSISPADLVRFGKDVLHQVAQQYSHYVTPAAGMGSIPPKRMVTPP
jgi:hypothetical protein